jgi:hypothetical protein
VNINQTWQNNIVFQIDPSICLWHICLFTYLENLAFVDGNTTVYDGLRQVSLRIPQDRINDQAATQLLVNELGRIRVLKGYSTESDAGQ